jgi:predicted RecA/RadA family phage recombinase
MPKYRTGAYEKGSKTKGSYVVVEANNEASAMVVARRWFPNIPITRCFAAPGEPGDKMEDGVLHPFTLPKPSKDTTPRTTPNRRYR